MKRATRFSIATQVALLIGVAVVPGCSGPQEDVRVTFCKDLITTRLDSPQAIQWKSNENEIRRPEYAKITLMFEAQYQDTGTAPMRAACLYKYAVADENAMTHSDPLSAYATVPYRMTLNGEPVAGPALNEAIKTAALKQGKELVDRVQKGVADTAQQIKDGLAQ